LRLYDGRVVCRWCDGLLYRVQVGKDKSARIARLRAYLYGPGAKLNGRPATNRGKLERALRLALIAERRARIDRYERARR
jgi:hypothetical protein